MKNLVNGKKMELGNLVLYTSGLCNLKCNYCFIHKNPTLIKLHDTLMNSYNTPQYYLDFIEKLKEDYNFDNLFSMTFWGVEPTYGFKKVSETVRQIMMKYPSIRILNTSTNFARDEVVEDLIYFFKYLKNIHNYEFSLQISIDGPEYLNDRGRGEGTTKKILSNLHKLISRIGDVPDNCKLQITCKSTISADEFPILVKDDALYNYFDFFDKEIWTPISTTKIERQSHRTTPVLPYQYTAEDGMLYNDILIKSLNLLSNNPFKYEFPVLDKHIYTKSMDYEPRYSYKYYGVFCGAGVNSLGLLPNYKVCSCQREFVSSPEYYDFSDSYTPDVVDKSIFSEFKKKNLFCVDYKDNERTVYNFLNFHGTDSTAIISSTAVMIMILARVGQVLEKYKDQKEATLAAQKFIRIVGNCYTDSYCMAGTFATEYMGILKLYLNGFLDTIDTIKEINAP